MFWQRALITLTLGPLGLFLIYLGDWYYFIPITVILLIGLLEYSNMMKHLGWYVPNWLVLPIVLLLLINGQWPEFNLFGPVLTFGLFATLLYALWRYEKELSQLTTADWLATLGGVILLGWLGSHFLLLRNLDEHGEWALLIIMTSWLSDTFAYLIGRQYGKHKLVPRLSPKKSVEGYIAGIILGTVGALITSLFLPSISLLVALVVGLVLTIIAPAGDLGISLLKREAGIKDSGHLFPGHGGALDRLDALLWIVALSYYLILLFLL